MCNIVIIMINFFLQNATIRFEMCSMIVPSLNLFFFLITAPAGQDTDNDAKHQRFKRGILGPISSNDSHYIKQALEDMFTTSLKICQKRGHFSVCPRGRPGPPGRAGTTGDKGKQGK